MHRIYRKYSVRQVRTNNVATENSIGLGYALFPTHPADLCSIKNVLFLKKICQGVTVPTYVG